MLEWEKAHPDQCGWERDDGNFFGFTTVAQGYLGKYTNFIYIPAVRDAALDAREGKGAPITMLIDWLVRETLASETDVQTFREQAQHQYVDILRPALAKLKDLGAELSQTLQTYVPGATIDLSWIDAALLEFPAPRAEVKLVEDNFSCGVTRTGHGLQRAFILTVLQHLAVAKSLASDASNAVNGAITEERSSPTKAKRPSVLLAIEEPEIYQHPNRQRYFAKVLLDLTTGARQGVALSTQVVYTTHSPLLVGIDRFNQIRRLSKVRNEADKPKVTQISHTTFDQIAEAIWIANDRRGSDGQECQKFQGETIRARLHTLMTPWVNEGFFADVVVLVEGEDDRAAIIGTATSLGHDFESVGISIIPCYGKPSMDRLIAIFQKLNIPCYAVWDSDFDKKDTDDEQQAILINQRLLRLMNRNLEEFPEFISENCACFKSKLETTARLEVGGPEYDELLQRAQIEFGYSDKKAATKSPFVISKVLSEARDQNRRCKTFELLVTQILALKTAGQ